MGTSAISLTRALHRAHTALLEDLRKLEQAVSQPSEETPTGLCVRLAKARAHLTEHFRFEERNGYMDAVSKRDPRFDRTIQQLAEEHRVLARTISELHGEAKESSSLKETLRGRVRTWIESVRRHEARENDLVQDAFNMDVGAED